MYLLFFKNYFYFFILLLLKTYELFEAIIIEFKKK